MHTVAAVATLVPTMRCFSRVSFYRASTRHCHIRPCASIDRHACSQTGVFMAFSSLTTAAPPLLWASALNFSHQPKENGLNHGPRKGAYFLEQISSCNPSRSSMSNKPNANLQRRAKLRETRRDYITTRDDAFRPTTVATNSSRTEGELKEASKHRNFAARRGFHRGICSTSPLFLVSWAYNNRIPASQNPVHGRTSDEASG